MWSTGGISASSNIEENLVSSSYKKGTKKYGPFLHAMPGNHSGNTHQRSKNENEGTNRTSKEKMLFINSLRDKSQYAYSTYTTRN